MMLHTRNEINRRARKALICDFSDAEKLRSQYEMMGNLSRTANGNLSGSVKLDEAEAREDGLHIEGVLEVNLLYLTDDDTEPVGATTEMVPFHCVAEADGINADSIWQMNLGLEQLTAVMLGGDSVEVKAVIAADLLVLQPIREQVVTGVKVEPLDMQKLQQMPGIVGYIVQPGDSLWKIAKKFHTTVDNIKETNGLTEDEIRPGDKLVLIKEI